jgi:Transglutaminase-like superfamily
MSSGIAKFLLEVQVLVFAASVPLLMRLGVKRLRVLLCLRPGLLPEEEVVGSIATATEKAVRWGRPFVRDGCLTRGLTQCYFLRKRGVDVSLVFGLDLADANRTGHCWLEIGSHPVLEKRDPHSRFNEIFRIPALLVKQSGCERGTYS